MKKYIFQDFDSTGTIEYNISGNDFIEFLAICCRYCKTLSLKIWPETLFVEKLDVYRVPKDENISFVYAPTCRIGSAMGLPNIRPDICYYRVCPELCALLPEISDSIFQWISGWGYTNPEDPVFYRADGSVFFSSKIHDGECILTPREGEDVSQIVSKDHWMVLDK